MRITSGNRLIEILSETTMSTIDGFKLRIIEGYPNSIAGIVYMPSVSSVESYGRSSTGSFWSTFDEAEKEGLELQKKVSKQYTEDVKRWRKEAESYQ